MTSPFDPTGTDEATHLVLTDGAGRPSLWPRWLPVPDGWHTDLGPAPYEDCLRRADALPDGPAPPTPLTTRPSPEETP